jgi:hypothetical protein
MERCVKEKMKILDDGTEIPQRVFGQLFGGGQAKARKVVRRLKVRDQVIGFTIEDMSPLSDLIEGTFQENERLMSEVETLRARIQELERMQVGAFGLPVRRKRGRPRKHPLPAPQATSKPRVRVKAYSNTVSAA